MRHLGYGSIAEAGYENSDQHCPGKCGYNLAKEPWRDSIGSSKGASHLDEPASFI